jgi:predicted RecB family nuclease
MQASSVITSRLFEDYLKCPTKCSLEAHGAAASTDSYADWFRSQNDSYRETYFRQLMATPSPEVLAAGASAPAHLKSATRQLVRNLTVRARNLESNVQAVELFPPVHRGAPAQFIPVRHTFANKVGTDDRLVLAFDAFVLSELLGQTAKFGKFIHGYGYFSLKVRLPKLISRVRSLIAEIEAVLSSSTLPELVLNPHCHECRFQSRCKREAMIKEDLSLLSTMTEKERRKFNSNGIFTVTQLSYTFRPRRRSKRFAPKPEKYHHALKALAIRQGKIHVVGRPQLTLQGTPVYLDVEGLPDRDFYYLIGVRHKTQHGFAQQSFWADDASQERRIWLAFLRLLRSIEAPVLVHYGSFETKFLRQMLARYSGPREDQGVAHAIATPVNLLSKIFAHIYFPTYSNGLKDVARYLGFNWSEANASGIQSIVWRSTWEMTREDVVKQKLIAYNAEDCKALAKVSDSVIGLTSPQASLVAPSSSNVVQAESLPSGMFRKFGTSQYQLPELNQVNRAAYWDYQRTRVMAKSNSRLKRLAHGSGSRRRKAKRLRINQIIDWQRPRRCPECKARKVYKHQAYNRYRYDVRFSSGTLKRWVTRYRAYRYRCPRCGAVFHDSNREWRNGKWGRDLRALLVYLTIELRVSQNAAARFLKQVLGLNIGGHSANRLKEAAAAFYQPAYGRILERIGRSEVVHADETKVDARGHSGYVWVFTSLEEAVYIYAPSREGELVRSLLKDFNGVLVSDFYAAYDSVDCLHQKCLIHLIRDLNDDLIREPFNDEMRELAVKFASLLKPIIETVDRFGLKARYLGKHKLCVERFFRWLSKYECKSEVASKCKKRLEKWRDSLFTFLDHDGVPWNNNNAEHAVKAFAMLRRTMGGATTEKGIREYLILLTIYETCAFKGANFLNFLRSGGRDIDAFVNI